MQTSDARKRHAEAAAARPPQHETPCRCGEGVDVFIPHCPLPEIRKGSRTPPSVERLRYVASVYQSATAPRLEAIMRALGISRSTAVRYVNQAKRQGLL